MGKAAVLDMKGNSVIVTSRPAQAWDQEIIKCMGLDPLSFDFIVLKSAVPFHCWFDPFKVRTANFTYRVDLFNPMSKLN